MGETVEQGGNRAKIAWPGGIFLLALAYLIVRVPDAHLLLISDDQAYQMALGVAIAKGRLPGFDFITQYGPAVALFSYIPFALTGGAIGEMITSALGYAAAVAIGSDVVRRSAGRIPALLAATAMLLWFPRFYKWYYCLFPLAGLIVARSYYITRENQHPARLVVCAWAQLVGVATMFRYDLGLEGVVFGILAILATHYAVGQPQPRNLFRDIILFAAGSLAIPVAYLAAIDLTRGPAQLSMFMQSIHDGAADTVEFYGVAPFRFSYAEGWAPGNALALLQLVLPVTYGLGALVGFLDLRSGPKKIRSSGFVLLCASLVGLGVYPQSIHRADLQHLLQVFFPFIIDVALLSTLLVRAWEPRPGSVRTAGIAALIATCALMIELLPGAGMDLGPVFCNPFQQWRTIAGLPASQPADPVADMATALRRLTPPDASVFLVMTPTDMPLLFFAQRYQPGIFPVYEAGLFSSPFWLKRNRAVLEASPPDYLIVRHDNPETNPAPFLPDLVQAWRSEFTKLLYRNERYDLLARP